jgi:uncharacterized membrane protein HdeD (DUF308 family)
LLDDREDDEMLDLLARNWWMFVLRGVLAILFGIGAFVWPSLTLAVLVLLYGAFSFADGVTNLAVAANGPAGRCRWSHVGLGLLGIGVGVVTFFWPQITEIALIYVIAAWALAHGVLEIIAAFELRKAIQGEWLLALSGLASIVFAILLIAFPGKGAVVIVYWIGAGAILLGVLLLALGLRLRGLRGAPASQA